MARGFAASAALLAIVSALLWCPVTPAQAFVLDFENFTPGEILAPNSLGQGITLSVTNNDPGHPDAAIVFDSNCGQQGLPPCTGGDSDLRTPGPGPGNTMPQGNIMIIAENLSDDPHCPFQDDCDEGIRALVMLYNGPETNVTITVSTKKHPGSGDLGVFSGINPGDSYEVNSSSIGKDKVGSEIRFEIKTASGSLLESTRLHTSCSQPIWSGMPVGMRQELVCFDSRDVIGDEDCGIGTGGEVVCEDGSSPVPEDGLVDEPDDEASGGTITLTFAEPAKCTSLRVIDVETTEAGDRLELSLVSGGTQTVPFALLGDNSAQTVTVPNPEAITELKIILVGSAGIDDITCNTACGDGVLDAGEECDGGDCCSASCTFESAGTPCNDGDACTTSDECDQTGVCAGTESTCGNGIVEGACGEQCDDGNTQNGDCCDSVCQFEAAGSSCADDGNICTDDTCDGSGTCTHSDNTVPCDDGNVCTTSDTCGGGSCLGGPPLDCDDGNVCTDDACSQTTGCSHINNTAPCDNGNQFDDPDICADGVCEGTGGCQGNNANCDDGNPCTDDICLPNGACDHGNNAAPCEDGNACTVGDTCSAGACLSGGPLDCNDGNVCTDDTCDPGSGCIHTNNTQGCDDGDACTSNDTCGGGSCQGTPITCDDSNVCTDDSCAPTQGCVFTNNTAPCDDGDQCTEGDTCDGSGSCAPGGSVCGNGVVDAACGEQCDDGNNIDGDGCEANCVFTAVCGNGILEPLEECDDGNTVDNDGCSSTCELEDKFCFQGKNVTVSRGAKFVTFESTHDFLGTNADGNQEIFVLNRKEFNKQLGKGKSQQDALTLALRQVTNTTAPVSNQWPTLNGSGRFIAFVSNTSLCLTGSAIGSECAADSDCPNGTCSNNLDANPEVFHFDLKRGEGRQISDSQLAENLHPNLRAFRGNLLMFDSDANLVPDRCSGGPEDRNLCQGDSDCPGGTCGNLEGNREVFEWVRAKRATDVALRQITTAPTGDSKVGRSLNFSTRATAFSSTADLLGSNADGSLEIFRVRKKPETLVPVTEQVTTSPEPEVVSEDPAQSKRRIVAFVSDGDLVPGENSDRNPEIFIWQELVTGGVSYTQVTHTEACANAFPSISSRARFIAFQSTCNLVPSKGNPGQSVFIYDVPRKGFLKQIVLRGPNGADSARPTVSRRVRVITFEADVGNENVACIFNARKEILEGPVTP